MKIPLKIKGTRNYVQGGDFFDGVEALLSNEDITELSFRRFTVNECELELNKTDRTVATLKTRIANYFINETDIPVSEKIEYKEELITANAIIEDNEISLNDFVDGFSVIEHIIALTKVLNNTLDPLIEGKWVFAQIKLERNISMRFEGLSVLSTQRIKGKFSKNEVIIDGLSVGFINFIVGTP